jgi:predicted amidohydrolase
MNNLRVSIVQSDIIWEDKRRNLHHFRDVLRKLKDTTDIAVLPELFSTGLSLNTEILAETLDGETIKELRSMAADFGFALTGSYMAEEDGKYYNRAFFIEPDEGRTSRFYDKRHLFSMAGENTRYSSGNERLTINYKGWNIRLLVCYDLRFPVWSRNVDNEYDLLIYVANWAASRRYVWSDLLKARAIENMCYVCGVNRVGIDANKVKYHGGSLLISPRGEVTTDAGHYNEIELTGTLDKESLNSFREKFPVWKDADAFEINESNDERL